MVPPSSPKKRKGPDSTLKTPSSGHVPPGSPPPSKTPTSGERELDGMRTDVKDVMLQLIHSDPGQPAEVSRLEAAILKMLTSMKEKEDSLQNRYPV